MIGRRGFFGTIAGLFAGLVLKVKSFGSDEVEKVELHVPDYDRNCAFGLGAGVSPGKQNSVAMGYGAKADESNMVALGNGETAMLRVGLMEFRMEDGKLYFVNVKTGKKYLVELHSTDPYPGAALGYPARVDVVRK